MTAFYNEIDSYAAAWLRNLIRDGRIAPGVVDERSIVDLDPDEIRGYSQCHFFAGIGIWSHSLRLAGWADDRPVWTGSCPCQPFSAAGAGKGHEDERHLWPAFLGLIRECRPAALYGEQVAVSDGLAWLDVVLSDLENEGYAVAAADLPAAGVGAPHIRQRLFFVADAERGTAERQRLDLGTETSHIEGEARQRQWVRAESRAGGDVGEVADDNRSGCDRLGEARLHGRRPTEGGEESAAPDADRPRGDDADGCGEAGFVGDTELYGRAAYSVGRGAGASENESGMLQRQGSAPGFLGDADGERESPQHGVRRGPDAIGARGAFWSDLDWIACRDGKARPVEPGSFPLAHGLPAGMGRLSAGQQRLASLAGLDAASLKRAKQYRIGALRGYGNAIVSEAAAAFILAAMP